MKCSLLCVLGVMLVAGAAGADRLDPWESRVLRIGPYEFDTRMGEPELAPELRSAEGEVWLVQLAAPVREQAKDVLCGVGVEFYEYIPNNAFLCRIPAGREALVRASGAAVWMGRYHPAYKITTGLIGVAGSVEVVVLGFPWCDGPELVAALRGFGMEVAEWWVDPLNVTVRGAVDAEHLPEVVRLGAIYNVEKWIRPMLRNHQAQWVMQTFEYGNRRLWDVGLKGQGQVGSTSDSGILTEHDMFRDDAVSLPGWGEYPTHRKIIAYIQGNNNADFGDNATHWWHGTHTAGSLCGDDSYVGGGQPYDGMALLAKDYFIDLGAAGGGFQGPTGGLGVMFNYGYNGNAGGRAFVHSMSWGAATQGAYSNNDRVLDNYIWNHRDCAVFVSAGNNPPDVFTITPANAKSSVAVGVCKNGTFADRYVTWSAHGPTDDGRYKPDILAPGEVIWSAYGPSNGSYDWSSGSSMSCPIAAGCALLVRQYLEDGWYPTGSPAARDAIHPSGALIKAFMINGGDENFIGGYTVPSNYIGWGRTCLDSVFYLVGDSQGLEVVDDTLGIQTGQTDSYQCDVIQAGGKFEATLVWSDQQGSTSTPATTPKIVNDLDLEVQAPGGSLYKGNVYSAGQSVTGGSYDRLNTVETVHLYNPAPGTYTVRVTAYDVPLGPEQPYALVMTGNFGADSQPPNPIGDLDIQVVGANVVLTWSDPGDDVGVVDYRIYRSLQAHFQPTGIPAATVTAPTTTWTDVGTAGNPALNFFYNVRARDAVGNQGGASNYVGEVDYSTAH